LSKKGKKGETLLVPQFSTGRRKKGGGGGGGGRRKESDVKNQPALYLTTFRKEREKEKRKSGIRGKETKMLAREFLVICQKKRGKGGRRDPC